MNDVRQAYADDFTVIGISGGHDYYLSVTNDGLVDQELYNFWREIATMKYGVVIPTGSNGYYIATYYAALVRELQSIAGLDYTHAAKWANHFLNSVNDVMPADQIYSIYETNYTSAVTEGTGGGGGSNNAVYRQNYYNDLLSLGKNEAAAAFLSQTNDNMTVTELYQVYLNVYNMGTSGGDWNAANVILGSKNVPLNITSASGGWYDANVELGKMPVVVSIVNEMSGGWYDANKMLGQVFISLTPETKPGDSNKLPLYLALGVAGVLAAVVLTDQKGKENKN